MSVAARTSLLAVLRTLSMRRKRGSTILIGGCNHERVGVGVCDCLRQICVDGYVDRRDILTSVRPRDIFMRISDHRYHRDVRKYNLAMRLIHHEARTGTIRHWTGLSGQCIRNLFRSYAHDQVEGRAARHRGPSPHMAELLLQSSQMRADVALLTSVFCLLDLILLHPHPSVRREPPNVARGEQMCTAFETFRALVPDSNVTLEHAFLLIAALIQGKTLGLGKCEGCGALIVIDFRGEVGQICGLCSDTGDRGRKEGIATYSQ
jgi:hypothetical protein